MGLCVCVCLCVNMSVYVCIDILYIYDRLMFYYCFVLVYNVYIGGEEQVSITL